MAWSAAEEGAHHHCPVATHVLWGMGLPQALGGFFSFLSTFQSKLNKICKFWVFSPFLTFLRDLAWAGCHGDGREMQTG